MVSSRGLKQVTKHFFFLLQITEMCPSIYDSAKEEVEEEEGEIEEAVPSPSIYDSAKEEVEEEEGEIEEAVPSCLNVTSADHHNQQACR